MSVRRILWIVCICNTLQIGHSIARDVCEIFSIWGSARLLTCLSESEDPRMNEPKVKECTSQALALVPYEQPVLTVFHEKSRHFTIGGHDIQIGQDWKSSGVAAVVWDAAVVLSEYLSTRAVDIKDKTVLELGAGTGLAGIVAAKLGAKVTLTDRESALLNLKSNVDNNKADCVHMPKIEELDWGQIEAFDLSQPPDIILGADIIYIEETFPWLLNTLDVLTSPRTEVLLSCRIRYAKDSNFLGMLAGKFEVTERLYDEKRGIHVYSVLKTENV